HLWPITWCGAIVSGGKMPVNAATSCVDTVSGRTTMKCGGFAGRLPDRQESLMTANLRFRRGFGVLAFAVAACLAQIVLAADIVTLRNGMILEGEPHGIATLKADPLAPTPELTQILAIDNRLTRTYVATKQLAKEFGRPAAVALERITLPQRIPVSGNAIQVVGMPQRIDPFDEWGRRTFAMTGQRGKTLEIVQGITEITPRWTTVRSEEHTSELQSLAYLVCRLLLEKKKKKQHISTFLQKRHNSHYI